MSADLWRSARLFPGILKNMFRAPLAYSQPEAAVTELLHNSFHDQRACILGPDFGLSANPFRDSFPYMPCIAGQDIRPTVCKLLSQVSLVVPPALLAKSPSCAHSLRESHLRAQSPSPAVHITQSRGSMSPRPILKPMPGFHTTTTSSPLPFASCPRVLHSPHVHFPPTPALTTTEMTHSPFAYDRAPIDVSPNTCALPERGGRVYFDSISVSRRESMKEPKGSYFHPRAFEVCEYESIEDRSRIFSNTSYDIPPSLTPDMSSESDESDISVSPPLSSPIPRVSSRFSRNTSYPLHHHAKDTQHQEGVSHSTASKSYPPSLVKEQTKDRSKESSGVKKNRDRLKREVLRRSLLASSFNEAPLDGCLSGF